MLMDLYYGAALQDESNKRDREEKEEEEGAEVLLKVRSCFAVLKFCVGRGTETSEYLFLMLC
jgi:hypothetical protein